MCFFANKLILYPFNSKTWLYVHAIDSCFKQSNIANCFQILTSLHTTWCHCPQEENIKKYKVTVVTEFTTKNDKKSYAFIKKNSHETVMK